jgi:penicillin amidase
MRFGLPTQTLGLALLTAHFAVRAITKPPPRPVSLDERLRMLPRKGIPIDNDVAIHWSDHEIPFIEAQSDHDLAPPLGLVHAHLRMGQMEMLRYLSQGRVSELIGPIAIDLDHLLRILDFGRAVPEILQTLPAETQQWLAGYVSGINHYLQSVPELPLEFDVLKIERQPWSVADVLRIGRLVSVDSSWIACFQLLRLRTNRDWPQLWDRLIGDGDALAPDPSVLSNARGLLRALALLTGRASNSVVISAAQSATGAALMANDPHLGIHVPGPWLIAGYRSPSHHAVGLMAPGLPFVVMGRNPWIAWGGTNLHAASSDFYDVSGLPHGSITERHEHIKVRWWPDQHVVVRETRLGPVISDARLLGLDRGGAIALRWMGHRASDEFTALLKVNQARNWEEFSVAIEGISVPGQTMTYADVYGHARRTMAVRLPAREPRHVRSFVLAAHDTAHWQRFFGSGDLLTDQDQQDGIVVSANDPPGPSRVPIGLFFSPPDRARRLRALLAGHRQVTVESLLDALSDVYMATSHELSRLFSQALTRSSALSSRRPDDVLVKLLAEWDGKYAASSRGALAFELTLYHLVREHFGRGTLAAYWATWQPRTLVLEDLMRAEPATFAASVRTGLRRSVQAFSRIKTWGAMHRMRLVHPFGHIPLFGGRYVLCDTAASGGNESVCKTGHRLTAGRHDVIYGSSARHISDLSDLDRNYFVLLGGQDGWVGSACYGDQALLWQRNATIQIPLRAAAVRVLFGRRTDLSR